MNHSELWRMLRWVLPLGAGLCSVVVGVLLGIELAILSLAGSVLIGVIFVLWTSVQGLTGEGELSLDEALSLAAPSAPEEEKRSVLRTLKDLEYERSVGKISEEDYAELAARYTARAKELIQAVDADIGQAKEHAERLLAKRLGADKAKGEAKVKAKAAQGDAERRPERVECPECTTPNEPDARFCKSCGNALEAAS